MADVEKFDRAASLEAATGGHADVRHGSKDAVRRFETHTHHVETSKGLRLERQDGSGRGHETEKRGGKGKGNWGDVADQDLDGEVLRAEEEESDPGPQRFSPKEDLVTDDKVLTLDEYEQQKKDKAANGN